MMLRTALCITRAKAGVQTTPIAIIAFVRLGPSIANNPEDVEATLRAVRALA